MKQFVGAGGNFKQGRFPKKQGAQSGLDAAHQQRGRKAFA